MQTSLYKVVVAGGRDFTDYPLLAQKLDQLLAPHLPAVEIVSGTAKGADQLGERYAQERGLAIQRFPANWTTFGKRAGVIRNTNMAKYADEIVVFWDGQSRGSAHMRETAKAHQKPLRTIYYTPKHEQ